MFKEPNCAFWLPQSTVFPQNFAQNKLNGIRCPNLDLQGWVCVGTLLITY